MSTPYGGIDNFPATGPLPDDGDAKTAASVNVALEALFDRTTSLANFILGAHPGGTLWNGTLKGNTTIRNNGADNACNFIGVDIAIDDVSTVLSRSVWNVSEGSWLFGGAGGQFVSYACPTFFSQPMSATGGGRLRKRRQQTVTTTGNRSINVATTDIYVIRLGDIASGDRGVLPNGTADGSNTSFDMLRIASFDTAAWGLPLYAADAVTALNDNDGSPIVMRGDPTAPGEYATVLLMWNGTRWEMVGQ